MPIMPKATPKPGYRPQAEDTSIDADVLLFSLLRQLTPQQKAQRFASFNQKVRQLTLSQLPPGVSAREYYIRKRLGAQWLPQFSLQDKPVMIQDPIAFIRKLAGLLEPLEISYFVGGSVASSLWGESRYTEDIDLVIELSRSQVQPLVQAFLSQGSYYISEIAIEEAINSSDASKSFNVLDNETLEKADLFVLKDEPFAQSKMARRVLWELPEGSIHLCSAEDIILQKLLWRRGSQSEKQWRDVLGVLKVQGAFLDYGYLGEWAARLKVDDDLAQAFVEAGL